MTNIPGAPQEGTHGNELNPAAVAGEILALAEHAPGDGSAISLIARELRALDASNIGVDDLYYAVSGPFDKFDSGTGNEQFLAARDSLPEAVRGQLDGITSFIDQLNLGTATPNAPAGPILNRNFGLAEGQVAAVVRAHDHEANETGGVTDRLFVLPTQGGYYTVRFHETLDEDYDSHRSILDGLPTPSEGSSSELVLYAYGSDYNLRDPFTGNSIIYR